MSIPVLSRRLAASFFISAFAAAHPAAAQDVSRAADAGTASLVEAAVDDVRITQQ